MNVSLICSCRSCIDLFATFSKGICIYLYYDRLSPATVWIAEILLHQMIGRVVIGEFEGSARDAIWDVISTFSRTLSPFRFRCGYLQHWDLKLASIWGHESVFTSSDMFVSCVNRGLLADCDHVREFVPKKHIWTRKREALHHNGQYRHENRRWYLPAVTEKLESHSLELSFSWTRFKHANSRVRTRKPVYSTVTVGIDDSSSDKSFSFSEIPNRYRKSVFQTKGNSHCSCPTLYP
jgi:hypothetical protein